MHDGDPEPPRDATTTVARAVVPAIIGQLVANKLTEGDAAAQR
jgi:hypothetical protein